MVSASALKSSNSQSTSEEPVAHSIDRPNLPSGFVQVGVVVGSHGRDGRIRVMPTTDNPERFKAMSTVYINRQGYTIREVVPKDPLLLLHFNDLKTREGAVALTGLVIEVPESDIPPLAEGSYYHFQLLNMSVRNVSGVYLGQLVQILNTGANDVYVVENTSQELLIPAISSVIISVDLDNNRITVDLPEGLVWTNVQNNETQDVKKRRRPHKPIFRRTS